MPPFRHSWTMSRRFSNFDLHHNRRFQCLFSVGFGGEGVHGVGVISFPVCVLWVLFWFWDDKNPQCSSMYPGRAVLRYFPEEEEDDEEEPLILLISISNRNAALSNLVIVRIRINRTPRVRHCAIDTPSILICCDAKPEVD